MQPADLEARKILALQKTVQKWLEGKNQSFDPGHVSDLFHRYSISRARLAEWMPDVFADLPERPAVTEAYYDGQEMCDRVPREQLMALENDLEYCLRLLMGFVSPANEPAERTHSAAPSRTALDPASVFVIHGRNEKVRRAMFEFLRSIGLKPMEWLDLLHSTGVASPYIGEVLNQAFSRAQAIVALLTPDDLAKLHPDFRSNHDPEYERRLTGQARPNVLFETGMALGRCPDRTVIVTVGETRPFSDISGVHVVRLNNTVESRQGLAARLQACGCPIHITTQTDWHIAGDFTLELSTKNADLALAVVKDQVASIPLGKVLAVSRQGVIERLIREGVDYSEALIAFDALIEKRVLSETMLGGVVEYLVHLPPDSHA